MKKTRIIIVAIISFLILMAILVNYSKNVDRSMVVGTYIANFKNIKSTLVMKEDGTYDYYLETEGGEKYFNSNDWLYDDDSGRSIIQFYDFKYSLRPFSYSKETLVEEPVFMGLPVVSDYKGRIKIIIDEDMGLYYSKQ